MFGKHDKQALEAKKQLIFLKIRPIIARELEIDENKIQLKSNLIRDLHFDPLGAIELVMAMEEEFKLEIPDGETEKFKTMEDVVRYLAEKVEI